MSLSPRSGKPFVLNKESDMYFGKTRDISQIMTIGQVIDALSNYSADTKLVVVANQRPCGMLLDVVYSHIKGGKDEYVPIVCLDVET